MIKEIEQISQELVILNSQVYGAILSEKDLILLEEALVKIKFIQENINNLLEQASLTSITNTKGLTNIVTKIYELLTELGITFETIHELLRKFVCNYEEEWNIIKTNHA
ncbi:MAG TPA: hypothetical protein VLB80_03345 [Candidatus Babeliales bacterium]|nr:hypothetical protein [Candidatus Babeliales bacterium]